MQVKTIEMFGKKMQVVAGLPSENELALMVTSGLNVLFIGNHGTGKTETVKTTATNLGLQLGYYHTPSLDPYIDFIGVPYPSDNKDGTFDLLKSRQILDAEVLFFDEINRADDRILNGLFEIIQFRSVNGVPFTKVRAVFAAINPAEDGYHVNEMDAALLDRFDAVIYVEANYNEKVIARELGDDPMANRLAKALVAWTPSVKEGYISPRALSRIGRVFSKTNSKPITLAAVPLGVVYSQNELWGRLTAARDDKQYETSDPISKAAAKKSSGGSIRFDKNEFNHFKRELIAMCRTGGNDPTVAHAWIADLQTKDLNQIRQITCSATTRSNVRQAMQNVVGGRGTQPHGMIEANKNDPHVQAFMKIFAPQNAGSMGWKWFNDNGFV